MPKKILEILMKFLSGFETLFQDWLDDFWLIDIINENDQSEIIKPMKVLNKGETDLHWDIRAIFVTTREEIIFVSLVGLSEVSIEIFFYNFPKSKKLLFCNQGRIKYWCPMWFLSSRKSLPNRNYYRWPTWRKSRNFRSTIRNDFKLVTKNSSPTSIYLCWLSCPVTVINLDGILVTSMLVTDVGDQMCWWQV